jgi:serine/threonine-protein kinase RsbW
MNNPAKADSSSPDVEHAAFHLPSTLDSVGVIERAVEGVASRMGFDEDTASNMAMVTREAAINACKHGNKFATDKQVDVAIDRQGDTLKICISDQGEGLDPKTLPDPLDPANLLRSSGRGVFLMRAIMDEVHFRQLQPGTEVTLIKHRHLEATS